jgi:hypothetical protein
MRSKLRDSIRKTGSWSMMFRVDLTLGIFWLLAVRDPSASRSLIALAPATQTAQRVSAPVW